MARPTFLAVPNSTPVPPPGAATFQTAIGWVAWGVTACAVLGLLVVAGSLMLAHQRGRISEHGAALGAVLSGCVLAAFAGPIVTALGLA